MQNDSNETSTTRETKELIEHRLITVGIIAEGNEHLNDAYQAGGKWDSQQAEKVRELRTQLATASRRLAVAQAALLYSSAIKQDNDTACLDAYVREKLQPYVDALKMLEFYKDEPIGWPSEHLIERLLAQHKEKP